jgi:hypothetical protein
MKKQMLLTLLVTGCIISSLLSEDSVQNNEHKEITEQEEKVEQPKVLDYGLDTKFKDYTLDDIVNGKSDLNIIVAKYNKRHNFEESGSLKDLNKYPKAREHLKRNNAVICFDNMELRDSKGNSIQQIDGIIIVKTRNTFNCAKFYNMFEQFNFVDPKTIEQPRIVSNGLETDFKNSTLYKIAYEGEGTEEDANTELYTKNGNKFSRVGRLKRLKRYLQSKAQIEQNNAVICPKAIIRKDRDGIDRKLAIIIDRTDNPDDCAKFNETYENEKRNMHGYVC